MCNHAPTLSALLKDAPLCSSLAKHLTLVRLHRPCAKHMKKKNLLHLSPESRRNWYRSSSCLHSTSQLTGYQTASCLFCGLFVLLLFFNFYWFHIMHPNCSRQRPGVTGLLKGKMGCWMGKAAREIRAKTKFFDQGQCLLMSPSLQ